MSDRKAPRSGVVAAVEALLAAQDQVSAGEVARAARVTRQAAHYHLRRLVDAGVLRRVGAGRGSRYVRAVELHRTYGLAGLREDEVWDEVSGDVAAIGDMRPNVAKTLRFAFTEMLNNAIDHSAGTEAVVTAATEPRFSFRIVDDGVGAFRHLASRLGLEDDVAAAFELMKGKRTAAPGEHSGQGIFFTSRLVDRFGLEANAIRLTVDNDLGDFAIGDSTVRLGTTVWWEVDPMSTRDATEIFRGFTDAESLEFTRTVIPLRVLGGPSFISRAEARRVTDQLERFEEAVLDFSGVDDVGQGFVDELFRVWAVRHPETRLVPVSMSPAVERMIRSVAPRSPSS